MSFRELATLITFLVGTLTLSSDTEARLLAGAAKESIVPPFPTQMGGFGDRTATFTGTHDDIFVRALVLDDDLTQLVLIGSDLMAVDAKLVQRVRNQIEKATGIPPHHIMISATHSHSAPSYYQLERQAETELPLEDFLVERFVEAALEAYNRRVPARLGFHAGELTGASRNRQQGNEEVIDTQVGVLRVEEQEGREIIAILYNFTAHPVILGAENLLLSGEYPGTASRAIEQLMGGIAIFTQGATGDVTIHRSGDPFLEIKRVGRLLAGEVIKSAEFVRNKSEQVPIGALSKTLQLPPKDLPSLDDAKRSLDEARATLDRAEKGEASPEILWELNQKVRFLSATLDQARDLEEGTLDQPESYEVEVQVLRIGDLIIVALPGEVFVEYALEMRSRVRQMTGMDMCFVGFANGYIGYVVTPRGMETGGYEASVTRLGAFAGRQMIETAMTLFRDLVN
ncbi:MAG: neutral/alkaline non-lysosomal ceramidase N-terminal domain-containing protein [bacterium]